MKKSNKYLRYPLKNRVFIKKDIDMFENTPKNA